MHVPELLCCIASYILECFIKMIKTVKTAHFAYFIYLVSAADQKNLCTLNSHIYKVIDKVHIIIFFKSFAEVRWTE